MTEIRPPVAANIPRSNTDSALEELVVGAMGGDRRSFHSLADRFHNKVYRMIFYRVRSEMDAEDLAQDVFLTAFRKLPKLREPNKFQSWLFSIALNRVRDFRRKKAVAGLFGFMSMDEEEFDQAETASSPSGELEAMRSEFWSKVQTLLARLSKMEREVFLLRFIDELSIIEISEALGKKQSTVKTHLYRAIGKFRDAGGVLCQYEEACRHEQ